MFSRRHFLMGVLPLPLLLWLKDWPRLKFSRTTTIAFGSCNEQYNPQPIWNTIAAASPDLFIFCGDNVYADTLETAELQRAYDTLAAIPEFARFRERIPIVATWDDHDFGMDGADASYPLKAESKEMMLKFFGEPEGSVRHTREGIYTSHVLGEPGGRVQILLLDLRWFRTHDNLLGEQQWQWLEEQLREPAEVRLLVSSSQFAVSGSQWDKWEDYPLEKSRLLALVDELNLHNLIVLSGDMHFGEISGLTTPGGIELIDFTSSGLNRWESAEGIPNSNRIALFDTGENFGWVEIDWDSTPLTVKLELRDLRGQPVLKHLLKIKPRLNPVS